MKKKPVALLTLLIFGALISAGLPGPMICIDPGHGGSDPGAVSYCTEKAHNLDCSLKFRDWWKQGGEFLCSEIHKHARRFD
jgi:N-acetylmuramoyl-L-alanine amidase